MQIYPLSNLSLWQFMRAIYLVDLANRLDFVCCESKQSQIPYLLQQCKTDNKENV
jgi:hypothetical protein